MPKGKGGRTKIAGDLAYGGVGVINGALKVTTSGARGVAGVGGVRIAGGIASKGEAEVINGALKVTGIDAGGGSRGFVERFYGESAGFAQTSLNVMGDNDDGLGVPVASRVSAGAVAVVFRHTAPIPPGINNWTLRLRKWNSSLGAFVVVAVFSVDVS